MKQSNLYRIIRPLVAEQSQGEWTDEDTKNIETGIKEHIVSTETPVAVDLSGMCSLWVSICST